MLNSKISTSLQDFVLFRDFVQKEYGLILKDEDISSVCSRLTKLIIKTGCSSLNDLCLRAKNDPSDELTHGIIESISSSETEWFRDKTPWIFFHDKIVPYLIDDLRNKKKENIMIWSAGASTGQEPYSVAMLVFDSIKKEPRIKPKQFYILATDISPSAIYIASSGRYTKKAMSEGMLPGFTEKYFVKNKDIYEIVPEIKNMVYFMKFNLHDSFENLPTFDIVFCRNVLTLLSDDNKTNVLNKISSKLDKSGYLFVGHDEALSPYTDDFDQFEFQQSKYYRPKNKTE